MKERDMLNLDREITPEDFAIDPERIWWTDHPEGREAKRAYYAELEELKRLYELQEEAKAKAHFKAEQARKEQIQFSESLAMELCHRVAGGEFLTIICKEPEMPTTRMVIQWKKEYKEFALLYDEAIRDRLEIFEDQLVTIADSSENDFKLVKKGGKQVKVLDAEVISRAKLMIDVRKAHLRAYRPERWSEQSTLNVNNYDAMDIDNMTQEEMDKKIAELESKEAVVKEPKAA
jgi:hypothetical protein